MVVLKNAIDTWNNQANQNKNYGRTARLHVLTASGADRRSWIFFTRPWPPGSVIISAKLRLWNGVASSGAVTLTINRAATKWALNKTTWNTNPGVIAGSVTVVKGSGVPAGTLWEADVTSLIQAVADGGVWYGFRVTGNNTTALWFHSTQSTKGAYRPVLEVTWSMPPDMPTGLSPSSGRAVSLQKPVLRSQYRDPDGENTMASIQVQIDAANDFSAGIDFDSGEVAATYPQLDLAATAYAGLAVDATTYWRTRHKDSAGIWSPWSLSTSFVRKSKGVVAITAPATNFIDGSPVITWTFTGSTQRAYQVIIAPTNDPNNWVWNSGKVTSTALTASVPFGKIVDSSLTYVVTVRVWDNIEREDNPGDSTFVEAQKTGVGFTYNAAVAPVTSLNMSSDPLYPIANLTWNRTTQPAHWQIQRSADAGATWQFVSEHTGSDLFVSGTSYAGKDMTAAPYTPYQWRVLAVDPTNGMSASNPVASGEVRRLAPFLMRQDGTDPVVFMNPRRNQRFMDIQEVHEVLGSAPAFVVTQKLGGTAGHVEGTFDNNVIAGITAKQMYARFKAMRKDAGVPMILSIVDEQKRVVPYNMQVETLSSASTGIYYYASFDYVEV